MRNSERLGYGDNAKRHFLEVNKCSPMIYAKHYADAQVLFDIRNEVLRWRLMADLGKFGGYGIELKEKKIPLISNPYEAIDWGVVSYKRLDNERGVGFVYILIPPHHNQAVKAQARLECCHWTDARGLVPRIHGIAVDNYQGTITIAALYADKIEWIMDGQKIKTKYNFGGKFNTTFKVENLDGTLLRFRLMGESGWVYSQPFRLYKENA